MERIHLDPWDTESIASVFNSVYQGYVMPVDVSAEWLEQHVRTNDIRTDVSQLWLEDGNIVAMAMLGVRGDRGWVGGFGVAPDYRGRGLSHELIVALLDEARRLGLRTVQLEVITSNERAIRTYERAGFQRTRDLLILSRQVGDSDSWSGSADDEVRELDAQAALAVRRRMDAAPPVWQREPAGGRHLDDLRALVVGGDDPTGLVLYQPVNNRIRVFDIAAVESNSARALTRALVARWPDSPLLIGNEPEDSALPPALYDAGWSEVLRQHEMSISLD